MNKDGVTKEDIAIINGQYALVSQKLSTFMEGMDEFKAEFKESFTMLNNTITKLKDNIARNDQEFESFKFRVTVLEKDFKVLKPKVDNHNTYVTIVKFIIGVIVTVGVPTSVAILYSIFRTINQ